MRTWASRPPSSRCASGYDGVSGLTSGPQGLAEAWPTRYGHSVGEQRWPWLLTAMLMLASAAAQVWSTFLHWLPCRGSMLSWFADGFSEACLRRMDGGLPFPSTFHPDQQAPWASELGVAATGLTGMALLTLVLGLRWSLRTKAVAALPGLAALVLAVVCGVALAGATPNPDEFLLVRLRFAIEWSAVLALIMILVWQPEVRGGRRLLRLLLVLWGTTAFGLVHFAAEWIAMGFFNAADWDVPPGTGYLTGALLIISGSLTVLLTLRPPQTDTTVKLSRAAAYGLFT
jgi:hypothetical protein